MDNLTAYSTMMIIAALTIIILALWADGWDGWK